MPQTLSLYMYLGLFFCEKSIQTIPIYGVSDCALHFKYMVYFPYCVHFYCQQWVNGGVDFIL